MLFANFMRRSGAQFITSLVVMFNGALPAQATDTAKPFNRPLLFAPKPWPSARSQMARAGPGYQLLFRPKPSPLLPRITRPPQLEAHHRRRHLCCRLPFASPAESP